MKILTKCLLLSFVVAISFSSCKQGRSWFKDNSNDTICIDTFKYVKVDSTEERSINIKIDADYPSPITGPLSASVASWIRKSIGKNLMPPDTMDGQKVVDFLGKQILDSYNNEEMLPGAMEYIASVKMVSQRRRYVSYVLDVYEYTGGAHGMNTISGMTFSQVDGKQYGWELLKDTAKTGFRKLLKSGVRKYFSTDVSRGEISDDELCGMLIIGDPNETLTEEKLDKSFPLPKTPPYFTRKGVTFVYQAYEIAPYAAGIPTFTIDFDVIDKYLSRTGKQLLKKHAF